MFVDMAIAVAKIGTVTVLGSVVLKILDGNKMHSQMIFGCGASVAAIEVSKYVVWRAATTPNWIVSIQKVGDFITNLPFIN